MKKNSFIEGTIIATAGILLVRAIGIIYVIPFNAIIGEAGGALYGYGYNIYQLFLSISSAGFPFAVSKIVSEYNALGYKQAIFDTYKISLRIISLISVVMFLVMFGFAPVIARFILGDFVDSSSISDVAFVIRMVSFALLVIPFLSVTKGFLQGFKYITPYSVSQVIEQVVRVLVILVGSFLCVKVLNLPLRYAVGIAVFGAFIGGVVAYLYLRVKMKKANLLTKEVDTSSKVIEKNEIVRKIFAYSIPFILISLVNNLYTTVDMVLLSRTMNDLLRLNADVVSSVIGIYTTWGIKLNNVILAVSTGLVTSLMPNIVSSFAKKDMSDVNEKFNKAIQCVLLIIVPMTLFLSLLAEPVWTMFYGDSYYGPLVYKAFVFTALFGGVYTIVVNTLQGLSKYKLVTSTVLIGLFTNAILDVPLILLFDKLGFNASYGAVVAALIGYSLSIFISFRVLNKRYGFVFMPSVKRLPYYMVSWVLFILVILVMKLIVPTSLEGRLIQIPILCLYGVVSFLIYFYINYKNGNLKMVFGEEFYNKLKRRLRIKF